MRPVIRGIRPDPRRLAKASLGEPWVVEVDAFCDGHDLLACEVEVVDRSGAQRLVPMVPLGNDRWRAEVLLTELGAHRCTVRAVVDRFATWCHDLWTRVEAGASPADVAVELAEGARILDQTAARAHGQDATVLACVAAQLRLTPRLLETPVTEAVPLGPGGTVDDMLRDPGLAALVAGYRDLRAAVTSPVLSVRVDPERSRFSAWYELFPRSASATQGVHGTLQDVVRRLDYVAGLGFDVVYLPPIHPIGITNRKGSDGSVTAGPGDPGSPWAIGSDDGGHVAVHPELGTVEDVDAVVARADELGMAVALDLAFQCSPDHPWVHSHPEWFARRADGSIRFAENPPKRYEDIYPFDFECEAWESLWEALADVVRFWVARGVRTFRVDNPHTKPFRFWSWLIATVKREHPDVLFLAEAFTRPRVMEHLGEIGFDQSYTYFTWRTTKWELEQYLTELTVSEVADVMRPNLWPNTPDILTEQLQTGGTPVFVTRLILAATLSSSYGVYGPAFELQEHVASAPGSEEYRDSEKYTLRHWDLDRPDSLAPLMTRLNQIRRSQSALAHNTGLRFHPVDNDQLLVYSKPAPPELPAAGAGRAGDGPAPAGVLVVVNLDPRNVQSGWVDLELTALGLDAHDGFDVHDLLTHTCYRWEGARNFVILDPASHPAHVFEVLPPAMPR